MDKKQYNNQDNYPNNNYYDENYDDDYQDVEQYYDQPEENENYQPTPTRRSRQPHHPVWRRIGQICKWSFIIFGLLILIGIGSFAYFASSAPSVSQAQLQAGGSSALYTTNGKMLIPLGSNKRNYLKYDQIPQQLKDAVVSIEDKRFYQEDNGIDVIRMAGSFARNLKGNGMAGGSTLTQQLIKLSVFSTAASDRTIKRKMQEIWLAMHVSHQYTKQQILEYYINKVYMNYNNYGIGTAASYYYGKSINKLDLAQIALLAGMPNAPATYNPYIYPEKAIWRRNLVLKAMLDNNKITQEQYDQASKESIKKGLRLKHSTHNKLRRIDDPYIKEVVNEVRADGFDPYRDNLKITVNINQQAQNKLYELANNGEIAFTDKKMQVAASVVDPTNGHVIAILGGRHLPDIQLGLDRAVQTDRSTGSSIKPVLDYGPAIEFMNWSTAQVLEDSPYTYRGTNVQLYDWDNRYMGKMTMRYALEQSRNVPAVRTLEDVGINRGARFAKKLGVNVDPKQGLSVAIGANASTLQIADAFGAFANEGIYHKPQFVSKIEAPDGLTRNYDDSGIRAMKASTAYMITDMLKGVITHGSGTKAKINGIYQAGKTGTVKYSDSELSKYLDYKGTPKDSWFVGYTRNYSIGVWTGYDKISQGKLDKVGQQSATALYKAMMSYLMKDKTSTDWDKPDSVIAKKFYGGNVPTVELYVAGHVPADDEVDNDRKRSMEKSNESSSNSNKSVTRYYIIQRPKNNNQNNSVNKQDNSQNQNRSERSKEVRADKNTEIINNKQN